MYLYELLEQNGMEYFKIEVLDCNGKMLQENVINKNNSFENVSNRIIDWLSWKQIDGKSILQITVE